MICRFVGAINCYTNMLKIRLARVGKKKKPTYRFVVSESGRDLYGPSLEILGHFNPFTKVVDIEKERVLYWMGNGAQLSPTVHNMFVDQNVITAPKVKASKPGKKPEAAATPAAPAAPSAGTPQKAIEEKVESVVDAPAAPVAEDAPAPAEIPAEPVK